MYYVIVFTPSIFSRQFVFSVLKWPRSVGLKRHNYKFLFIFSHIGTPCVSSLITSEKPDQWEHSRHTKFVTAGQTFLLRCVIVRRFAAENVRNKDCCRHVASLLKVCVCGGGCLQTHPKNLDKLKKTQEFISLTTKILIRGEEGEVYL